jgi:hypothetical protein
LRGENTMKNGIKLAIVGTVTLSLGVIIGFKSCQKLISVMLDDKDYVEKIANEVLVKKIGKEKLERMAKIYYEKEIVK